jgi:hypothetical protein
MEGDSMKKVESHSQYFILMLIAIYRTEDDGVKEIHTSPNLLHSRFPRWKTHIESLHSQDPPLGYRQTDVHQILFSNKNKN